MACSAVGRRTGRDPRIRQTNTSSDAGGDPFFRYRACPVDLRPLQEDISRCAENPPKPAQL